ncbi:hypothetical protein [Mumia sp. Pv 4-285]|uniref:hypothetical protein n=1 Tax=Mumia qirimensis TaxID=3234852 RepID=UPI00351D27A5
MSTTTVVARTCRAEVGRVWTLRSSFVLAAVTAAAVVAFGGLVGSTSDPDQVSPGSTAWDGGQMSGMFALFGILALSVVTATADYGTGGIIPTLQWTPRRGVLLCARTGVIVATGTALGLLSGAAASLVVWLFLPGLGLPAGDGAAVMGGLAYVHATGALLAVGLGLLLRSTAGGLVSVIALVLVLPMLLAQLGYTWSTTVAAHMPGTGALFLIFGEGPSDDMTAASARLTLAIWATVAISAGGWRLLRTDAT